MTQNQLAYLKYAEDVRANKAKEEENIRTNKRNEDIKMLQAKASEKQANVAEANLYKTKVLGQELPFPGLMYASGRSSQHGVDGFRRTRGNNVLQHRSMNDLVRSSFNRADSVSV